MLTRQELTMDWKERIVATPGTVGGRPRIAGTRISVELILTWLSVGWSVEQVIEAYPHIAREDVLAALAFAAEMMREEESCATGRAGG